MTHLRLNIQGMHCASCVGRVEDQVNKLEGIKNIQVNLSSEQAEIDYDPALLNVDQIVQAVADAGYKAIPIQNSTEEKQEQLNKDREFKQLQLKTGIAFFFSITNMVIGMGFNFPTQITHLILLGLTLPVITWCAIPFWQGFLSALKSRSTSMDTLIVLGTTSAFLFSLVATFLPQVFIEAGQTPHVYYEVSSFLVAFILLGRVFEQQAKSKTSQSIRELLNLVPKKARVLKGGQEKSIPIAEIQVGDTIVIRPGEQIPVDGIILEGTSEINEAMINGESVPVAKKPGYTVIGGTVNKVGSFSMRATHLGQDMMLSRIVEMVRLAQSSKAPIQRYADKVSRIFIPAVLVVALATGVGWIYWGYPISMALIATVSVLIVACPCALGLAVPTAIMVAAGKGTERGILIKNAAALEAFSSVRHIVFDKTGTLTLGKPSVQVFKMFWDDSESNTLHWMASAASLSEHPMSQAVVKHAREHKVQISSPVQFKSFPGKGISARANGKNILLGSPLFINENGASTAKMDQSIEQISQDGMTPIVGAIDQNAVALFGLLDVAKVEAAAVIQSLKAKWVSTSVLSGDRNSTVQSVAKSLGIHSYLAQVLPADKAEIVKKLKQRFRQVAMVGDGVNDAPALATADVGIALGTGTDVAIESADITLLRGDLTGVVWSYQLSKKTMQLIRQNLFASFFYNALGIPLAALGLLNPMVAGAAMALSSVSVVLNSLRLRRWNWK